MTKAVARNVDSGSGMEVVPQRSSAALTPMEMLNAAMERGDAIEKLERLMDLNDRWEKAQAKKAFLEAKAAFKAEAPVIAKDKENKQYGSRYSSIGNVVNKTNEVLSKFGLDARWEYDQSDSIKVTCILSHLQGHSENVSLKAPPDTSGQKNPIQQIKSTTTYLKLATFEAVTGIATEEGSADDDGNGAGGGFISSEQESELRELIEAKQAEIPKFCAYFKIDKLGDLKASDFQRAMTALKKRSGSNG